MKRRVVVSGIGMISPVGNDPLSVIENCKKGSSFISEITYFNTAHFRSKFAGKVDFEVDGIIPELLKKQTDIGTHYAFYAADQVLKDARLDPQQMNTNRFGIMLGNSLGGCRFGQTEMYNLYQSGAFAISPFMMTSWFYAASMGQLSIHYNLKGFSKTVVTDRASGTDAIGYAYELIKNDEADIMLAGGVEAPINEYGLVCVDQSGATIPSDGGDHSTAYRPFAKGRQGFFVAEGAGLVCIEEYEHAVNRGAKIYAEILGYFSTCDAVHPFLNNPDGKQFGRAIATALERAEISAAQLNYINLDATGTVADDIREFNAIKTALNSHHTSVYVSAPKSMYGHSLGAAGGIDFIETVLAVKDDMILPTINFFEADPKCELNMVAEEPIYTNVNSALSISCGFGGINSAIVVSKP